MEKSKPQLSSTELRQLRWFLGGAIGLLSAWTLFYMEVDAVLALTFLTLVVPVFTFSPRLSLALPSFVHRLAFPLIVTVFALDLWANREPLPAMIRLDLMLLCYRCAAPRRRREDLQLILLSLFVVVVTGVFTVSPAFVVQILFFTAASLALLFVITLSDTREGEATAGWERVRWRELFARVRAVSDLRVLGLGAALFGGLVALSVVLFLALPRVELSNSFFFDKLITKKSRTGFSDDVRFNEVVDISEDKSEAFEVDVSDPSAVPHELYWRMVVLDEYSGEGFRMSTALRNTLSRNNEKAHTHSGAGGRGPEGGSDGTVWTVWYQPGVSRYLPLMGAFGRISFGEPQALQQSRAMRIAALQTEASKMVAYRVEGMDTTGILRDRRFALEKKIGPMERRRFGWGRLPEPVNESEFDAPSESPSDTPSEPAPTEAGEEGMVTRIASEREAPPTPAPGPGATPTEDPEALAERRETTFLELTTLAPDDRALLDKWVAEIGGAGAGGADFARRAGAWLQSRHTYSMQSRLPPGSGDRLIRWIASNEPGHCELFAGSIVVLARAAGVPARLVTGFKGGVWNEAGRFISVKNSDAHAWTEVWEEALGSWLRVDATPGAQITPATVDGAAMPAGVSTLERDSGFRARLDSLRVFWYRRIVNFDQKSQLDLLKQTKERLRGLGDSVKTAVLARLKEFAEWMRQPWDFPRVAGIALTIGLGCGGVVLWHRRGRAWWLAWRSRRSASRGHGSDPVRREASRWLSRLDGLDDAKRVAAPEARVAVTTARAQLLRLRYGAREGWAPPSDVFRLARRARREARRAQA